MNDLDTRNLYYAFILLTSCIEQQNERKVSVQHFDFVQYQEKHAFLFVILLGPHKKFLSLPHLRYLCVLHPAQRFSVAFW
jgi:hypothetical protein